MRSIVVFARTLLRFHWLTMGALQALIGCPGCGQSCTEQGCIDGARVRLNEPLPNGSSYVFQVSSDSGELTCTTQGTLAGTCDGTRGIALEMSGSSVVGFLLPGLHPKSAAVTILQVAEVVRQGTVSLAYQSLQPNGTGCPGECNYGEANL